MTIAGQKSPRRALSARPGDATDAGRESKDDRVEHRGILVKREALMRYFRYRSKREAFTQYWSKPAEPWQTKKTHEKKWLENTRKTALLLVKNHPYWS